MADDPNIKPGSSSNIARRGNLDASPIARASRGYLVPEDVQVADIVVGGTGDVTVNFAYPGTGGVAFGGTVPVYFVVNVEASGGLTLGGSVVETFTPGAIVGAGGIVIGGGATNIDVIESTQIPGRGAPAFRKRHVTAHQYIWHPRPIKLITGGGAKDVVFTSADEKLLSITLDKFIIPIEYIPIEIFVPVKIKVLDFSNFEELVKQPRRYEYNSTIGLKTGGSAEVTVVERAYIIAADEEEIILSIEDDAIMIYTYYSEKENKDIKMERLRKEDEEFLSLI